MKSDDRSSTPTCSEATDHSNPVAWRLVDKSTNEHHYFSKEPDRGVFGPRGYEITPLFVQSESVRSVAPIPSEFAQLASFYDVADMEALVRIQAEHIERLQKETAANISSFRASTRVREG